MPIIGSRCVRARNLKPGYFKNELLGSAEPLIGTLFQGLWCSADRAGRLEDRPLRLCAEIFPYRRTVTEKKVDQWLSWLQSKKFIHRYEVDGTRYIQVIEFSKHQNPHSKERPSEIPTLILDEHSAGSGEGTGLSTGQAQGDDGKGHDRAGLIPDSLIPHSLIPDSLIPHTPQHGVAVRERVDAASTRAELTETEHHANFERIKAAYPKFSGRQDWLNAEVRCRNHVAQADATWGSLLAVTELYAKHIHAKQSEGTQYVKTPGRFFEGSDADAYWRQEWSVPMPANGKSRPGAPGTHAEMKSALAAAVDPNDDSEDWL